MNYLLVIAHPDDEALGAGASIYKLAKQGHNIDICIMCGQVNARNLRPGDNDLLNDMHKCFKMLGINRVITGNFPNIKMNTVSHLELVQFIESAIKKTNAQVIITHHPADLNNDHVQTSLACQAAIRLFQRNPDSPAFLELLFMETLSSTEWNVNTSAADFRPNTYIEIGPEALRKKIDALSCYRDVMRPFPHPRSTEAITGLAAYRGAQSGCNYAEAFESAIRRIL